MPVGGEKLPSQQPKPNTIVAFFVLFCETFSFFGGRGVMMTRRMALIFDWG